jgi:hypothetical protein
MEPVRFADVLFTFLTLAITFAVLWGVNKVRSQSKQSPDVTAAAKTSNSPDKENT